MYTEQTAQLQLMQIIDGASPGVGWSGCLPSQNILDIPTHTDLCTGLLETRLPSLAGLLD